MLVTPGPDSNDYILLMPTCRLHLDLLAWKDGTPVLHEFLPDFHRLQLERWVWDGAQSGRLAGDVLDIGVETPRRWVGPGYRTVGERAVETGAQINASDGLTVDIVADVQALTLPDACADAIICTEVLEHVPDPFAACRELHRVLRPGGWLYVTSPFLWPWHGRDGYYKDFWRFTHEGWLHLLRAFDHVEIAACHWTPEGQALYRLLRQHEGLGFETTGSAATGYLCAAQKGGA